MLTSITGMVSTKASSNNVNAALGDTSRLLEKDLGTFCEIVSVS